MPTTTSPLTTPRSGFVQPAFRAFIDTDALRPKRGGWRRGGRPVSCPTRSWFAQIQLDSTQWSK